MGQQTDWSMKQIDDVYNGSAAVGAVMAWIVDQTTGFNKNKGAVRLITTVFSGVGVGGTLAFCYLYYQGVYEEGFQFSDFNYADEESYATASYAGSVVGDDDEARYKVRAKDRETRDSRNRQFPYDPASGPHGERTLYSLEQERNKDDHRN